MDVGHFPPEAYKIMYFMSSGYGYHSKEIVNVEGLIDSVDMLINVLKQLDAEYMKSASAPKDQEIKNLPVDGVKTSSVLPGLAIPGIIAIFPDSVLALVRSGLGSMTGLDMACLVLLLFGGIMLSAFAGWTLIMGVLLAISAGAQKLGVFFADKNVAQKAEEDGHQNGGKDLHALDFIIPGLAGVFDALAASLVLSLLVLCVAVPLVRGIMRRMTATAFLAGALLLASTCFAASGLEEKQAAKAPASPASLAAALGSTNAAIRFYAVDSLGKLGGSATIAPLVKALHDPDACVRIAAAKALGHSADPAAMSALVYRCNYFDNVRFRHKPLRINQF
jgi:hypothetical protein